MRRRATEPPASASAVVSSVDTPLQRSNGVADTIAAALSDWRRAGAGAADMGWAERYLRDGREQVYGWCERALGTRWTELRSYEGNSAPRWHLPSGGGAEICRALVGALRPHGVIPRLETRVTSLQRIHRGIACAIDRDGRTEVIEADTVVIATGGFSNNPEMLAASAPQLALSTVSVRRFVDRDWRRSPASSKRRGRVLESS